ncbi:hypothetical protein IW150_006761, partial [Coemansia sp. RSA 2607]
MSSTSNPNNAALIRSLKIKTSAVKRLVKDKSIYLSEVTAQQQRIETLRAKDGVHEADIR